MRIRKDLLIIAPTAIKPINQDYFFRFLGWFLTKKIGIRCGERVNADWSVSMKTKASALFC